ncbi:MAG: hypothetical protein ACOCVO_02325 [bacterium]
MELPALFALISAAILGLLPVLLLFGRRRMQRRTRSSERTTAELAGRNQPAGQASSGAAAPASGSEDTQTGERPILDRLARDDVRRERELRDAAIIAGASPSAAQTPPRAPARQRARGPVPRGARSIAETGLDRTPAGPGAAPRRSLDERLARLTPLQRAIAYGEILGPPAALRRPGRRDEL